MASKTGKKGDFTVTAHQGDAKTLLAFNLPSRKAAERLAGFTIQCQPKGQTAYYILNKLRFEHPDRHAQDVKEPATSTINAPIHKFRWLHVPGSFHGAKPIMGPYTYTVTPRYFDQAGSLQPLDPKLSASVTIDVLPFKTAGLEVAFTRGFTQSQAFVNHFGLKAKIRPAVKELLFDTSKESGVNAEGKHFTYADEYEWLGFTARQTIFDLVQSVVDDKSLHLDMFAYDLNEPDLLALLLSLAKQGRIRIILDNAALHHDKDTAASDKPEDQFEVLFRKAAKKPAEILRGKFGRYSHDKVLIVRAKPKSASAAPGPARRVLTGSTNFSVTGLYVNSNHVLVFNDPVVAAKYAEVFDSAWKDKATPAAFRSSILAAKAFSFTSKSTPRTDITFSPHDEANATKVLQVIVDRVAKEGKAAQGSVLFACMQLDAGTGPVYPALRALHSSLSVFSFGISDSPGGIYLYAPGKKTGVLVTGKPARTKLPPPFSQVPGVGLGHQIHHKFVVCGFRGKDPVVFCGSSNLTLGGEKDNGDNLLAIYDEHVATAFAIEAAALVDHFQFLNRASSPKDKKTNAPPANKEHAAVLAEWFLSVTDRWVEPYFDDRDLHYADRLLFA